MEKSRNIYRRINKAILDATSIVKYSADRRHFPQAFTHSGKKQRFECVRSRVAKSQKADFRVVAAISPELWRRSFLKLGKREKKVNTLPMRMQRALGSRPYYLQSWSFYNKKRWEKLTNWMHKLRLQVRILFNFFIAETSHDERLETSNDVTFVNRVIERFDGSTLITSGFI